MTTAERAKRKCVPLESGDRLTRAEFERRYTARPDIKKAELIEGVVYVASPVSTEQHGEPHGDMVAWIALYASRDRGLLKAVDSTILLDPDNEPQPDVYLARRSDKEGNSRLNERGFFVGAPELVAEIAYSSAAHDLGDKMSVYRRNGVREYIVWQIYEERIDWFRLGEEGYQPLPPNEAGIIESVEFPGLRLDVAAMLRGDLAAVLAALA